MIQVDKDGVAYMLFKKTKTASVRGIKNSNDNIFIPRSIKYHFRTYIVKSMNSGIFERKQLTSIKFDEDSQIETFDEKVFARSSIQNIEFPKNLTQINPNSFSLCNLQHVDLTKTKLKRLCNASFSNSGVVNVYLPKSIESIGPRAFFECKQLESVEIPEDSNLTFMGNEVFAFSSLKKFKIPLKITTFSSNWFWQTPNLSDLTFTQNQNRSFRWYNEEHTMIVEKSQNIYDTITFAVRCIKYAKIGDEIKHINKYAFNECSQLKYIDFGKNSQLETIGVGSFSCSSIREISIPKNVHFISMQAFYGCRKLKKIDLPENLCSGRLSYGILQYTSIETISIPQSIFNLEETSLADCEKLFAIEFLGKGVSFHCFCFQYFCYAQIISFPNTKKNNFEPDILRKFSNSTVFFFEPDTRTNNS